MTDHDPRAPAHDELASIASTDGLLERLLALRDAVEVLALLGPSAAVQQARTRRLGQLTHRLARLTSATAAQREALGGELARTEQELRAAFEATPLEAIEETFLGAGLAPRTVDRVSLLLIAGAGSSAAVVRLERIAWSQLLRSDETGRPALLPEAALSARLERLGHVRLASTEVRRAALQFLTEATRELGGATELEALRDGRLADRVAGYRHALRRDALDPAVLPSALELELALRAKIEQLSGGRAAVVRAFEDRRRQAEEEARLAVEASAAPEPTHPHDRATGLRRLLRIGFIRVYDGSERRGPSVWPWVLAIALLGGLLAWALAPVGDARRVLPADELEAISAVLIEGTIVEGAKGHGFHGALDAARWAALDAEGRQHTADAVREALAGLDVGHGVVRAEQALAFQFDAGTVSVPR